MVRIRGIVRERHDLWTALTRRQPLWITVCGQGRTRALAAGSFQGSAGVLIPVTFTGHRVDHQLSGDPIDG
jgi:hypothetical protein